MEQRPLRLGDILDDYCPRERRVTNHAIVAMIEEDVRQTRCTTCDTEHAYKGAKVPRRRKKETPDALYNEVLAGMPETEAAPPGPILAPPPVPALAHAIPADAPRTAAPALDVDDDAVDALEEEGDAAIDEVSAPVVEEGPVHRPLIRATLPRPEGQKDARPAPDFTMRQPIARNNRFRGGDPRLRQRGSAGGHGNGNGNGNGNTNGNRSHGGVRFGGPRPGAPGGRGPAGRSGGPAGGGFRGGGGRKRSR